MGLESVGKGIESVVICIDKNLAGQRMANPEVIATMSNGGKVLWSSPCCNAPINKMRIFTQTSYICCKCNKWGPWKNRLKVSANRKGEKQ
jgi:hypothetical protein